MTQANIAAPEALLSLSVQRKSFGNTVVLEDTDLALHARQTVALLGPSGCGKSTFLRIAAGLDTQFSGQLQHADGLGKSDGGVSIVFQEPRLMPWLTVAQNVGFRDARHADQTRVRDLLVEVGLSGQDQALPKQLSGGMAQRVAIARALYSEPRVLLLDEPFSAVDAFTRMHLQDLVLDIAARHGVAVLVVTHDVDEALYLSDRVLVMGARPGRVRHVLEVDLPRPRDRLDARLAALRVQALTCLHEVRAF